MFHSRLGILCILFFRSIQVSLQLPFHHLIMNLVEVILPVCIIHFGREALLRVLELIAKLFMPVLFLGWGPLDASILAPELDRGLCHLPIKLNNVGCRCQELFQNLFRHFFRGAQVTSDAHVCEGPSKPIFGDLAVQVGVLHVKSDTFIVQVLLLPQFK
jgi:hypothetical protein